MCINSGLFVDVGRLGMGGLFKGLVDGTLAGLIVCKLIDADGF